MNAEVARERGCTIAHSNPEQQQKITGHAMVPSQRTIVLTNNSGDLLTFSVSSDLLMLRQIEHGRDWQCLTV